MEKLIIQGGKKLKGRVRVSGAKNAALPILAATILAPGEHVITRVPEVVDLKTMRRLLTHLGATISDGEELHIQFANVERPEAPYDLVKTMRASSIILGPMLARAGYARISLPGGCTIGARPLNLHIDALKKMGAEIELEQGYIIAKSKKLHGAKISFETITVTGTEDIMMAATLADGETIIENAACEPEVGDLADYLRKMGAKISGDGTHQIKIEGVEELHASSHEIIPDRIETGTLMIAAAITGGDVRIEGGNSSHLGDLIDKLRSINVTIETSKDCISVKSSGRVDSIDMTTLPFPGFATDLQAQFMALMTLAKGKSKISETIFENRFQHVAELNRMGANIKIEGSTALIEGVEKLKGAEVMATDLRASASLILAALAAEDQSIIQRIYHLDRGYEKIDEKLRTLGADIQRV